MAVIETNGILTHTMQLHGEAGGDWEDLVMVHGLGTSMSFWYLPHAVHLAKTYRVTIFDLRGHGRSSMPLTGYEPANLTRDLLALLDALGIQRAHFVAHSFGGVVALSLACQQPERCIDLVVADTQLATLRHLAHPHSQPGQQLQLLLARYGIALDIDDPYFGFHLLGAVARLEIQNVALPAELAQVLGPLAGKNSKRTARQWLQLLDSTTAQQELLSGDGLTEERLGSLDVPVLAMYGERSRAVATGQRLSEILPRATYCGLAGAGHFFPSTHSEAFMQRCERFWTETRVANPALVRKLKNPA